MLFTITPDTSHGDHWLYLSNQVPDSILVLRSPLSTFHATFIAYLSQIATYEQFPSIHRHSARLAQRWFLLTALPVQQGSRRGAVFSALIIYQGGRDFMSSLHATFWFTPVILFTHKDLATSESGFLSEDIYTNTRNSPHTWYVLKSSDLCT